jgi:alkylation response protein AidB-like acyl-CoA dehydrogenase
MDLSDSPEEAAFRAEARAFLEENAPRGMPDYYDDEVDYEAFLAKSLAWQRKLYEAKWAGITWPKEFGGRGLGPIEQIIWNQESGRMGLGESVAFAGIALAGPTIIAHGSAEQKQRYLDPILRGDELWCQLFSEPGAGSDLGSLSTRAVKDGDEWVVNGQKTWCSGGQHGDFGILIARTDPKVPKHEGITYFLVDMKTPGIEVQPLQDMTGGAHFAEVFMNDVRIPDQNRVGALGGGWGVTMTTLMNERMAMGGLERMIPIDELLALAGRSGDRVDARLRDELAKLYTWVRTIQLLNARVITKLSRGQMPAAESSVMKLAIARVFTKAAELGVALQGPRALEGRGFWQKRFLGAPSIHIGGGTDEIQKNIAAERFLGLPREPSNDRDVPFEDLRRS